LSYLDRIREGTAVVLVWLTGYLIQEMETKVQKLLVTKGLLPLELWEAGIQVSVVLRTALEE
jgi:hypothetical protein